VHVFHCRKPISLLLRHIISWLASIRVFLENMWLFVFFPWNVSDLSLLWLRIALVAVLLALPIVWVLCFLWLIVVSFLLILLLWLVLGIFASSVLPLLIVVPSPVIRELFSRSVVLVLILMLFLVRFLISIIAIPFPCWGSLRILALVLVSALSATIASVLMGAYLVALLFFLFLSCFLLDNFSQILLRVVDDLSLVGLLLFAFIFEGWLLRSEDEAQFLGILSRDV
jgi:hypothetical protein